MKTLTITVLLSTLVGIEHINKVKSQWILEPIDTQTSDDEEGLIKGWPKLWPKQNNGEVIIPYKIEKSLTDVRKNISFILDAFKLWEKDTCLRMAPWDRKRGGISGWGWISIVNQGYLECRSSVGKKVSTKHEISLGTGCWRVGTAARELGHALGLRNEHQRSDRDKYLMFKSEANTKWYGRNHIRSFKTPYDYLSIMQIPVPWNRALLPRDPTREYLLRDHHDNVSHYDRYRVVHACGCIKEWEKKCKVRNYCLNYGYLGQNCNCICPPQTYGSACERKHALTLPAYPPPECGGHIHNPGTYASVKAKSGLCIWWIQPPKCQIAIVTITGFNFKCQSEKFGIRSANIYESDEEYSCGKTIRLRSNFIGKPDLVVDFRSNLKQIAIKGRIAFDVSFNQDPACINRVFALGECPYVKYTDGSIKVPIRYYTFNCTARFEFPGAVSVRATARIPYWKASRSPIEPYRPFYRGFVEISNLNGLSRKISILDYFNHLFCGNKVILAFYIPTKIPEYEIVLFPIMATKKLETDSLDSANFI